MPPAREQFSERIGEVFPYEMPFHGARVISCLVLALFFTVATAAVLVEMPETVETPFVLMPRGGADPVDSSFDGVIEAVHVETGREVTAGDLLFVVRSPRIQELAAELDSHTENRTALLEERSSLESTHLIQRDMQLSEIAQRENETAFRREYLNAYADVLRRMETLGAQGLASSVELLNHRLGYTAAERDASLAEQEQETAQLALTRLDMEHTQALKRLDSDLAKLDVRIESLRSQLRHVRGELAEIHAPVSGTVIAVARQRVGDVIRLGQELCQIAPTSAPLQAQLRLEEARMARLRQDLPVKLLFDAFPYQRYGVIDGTVVWLSPAAVVSGETQAFLAHVEPSDFVINASGYSQPLRAGMSGTARIQVGRRTLIEYAFEPIRRLRENLRDQGPHHAN